MIIRDFILCLSRLSTVFSGPCKTVFFLIDILNKIINAPCGTLKLLLALGVAKYIKSYKIHFVVQYATDYCPLEHDNYKTISAHLGSPISCYINNLHGAFIFLLSVHLSPLPRLWLVYQACHSSNVLILIMYKRSNLEQLVLKHWN